MSGVRLVLFDIDGTLVSCGQQVRPLLGAALEEVYGLPTGVEAFDFRGKTDPQIVLELMGGAGLARERVLPDLPRVREGFARRLEQALDPARMVLLPGVDELLADLAADSGPAVGLLTGNWEVTGRLKLAPFDLNRYFRFGAFGDDAEDRPDLLPIALERARASGVSAAPEETLIIGDSVNDVRCARAHGATCLAVATGWTPATELAAAGADRVIDDLTTARRVMAGLAG